MIRSTIAGCRLANREVGIDAQEWLIRDKLDALQRSRMKRTTASICLLASCASHSGGYPQLARSFPDNDRNSHSQGNRIPIRQSLLRTKRHARNICRSGAQSIEPTEKWRRVHRAPAVSASQGPRARDGAGTTASRSEAPQSNSVLPADRAYKRWAEACVSPPWNRGSATEPNANFVRDCLRPAFVPSDLSVSAEL